MLFLRFDCAPASLPDVFGAVAFRATLAALKFGLFQVIRNGPLGPSELACRLGTDERDTLILATKEGS